jgi:heme exporter protein C
MAGWSAAALGFNTRLSAMMAQAIAPTGAMMTFIALWTGAFWGRPTWGTYWAWDARMTSELILLFLYLGVIALRNAIDDPRRADRACGVLALTGVVNIPIIYFSVHWWNTLHQGRRSASPKAPAMAAIMLTGMLSCPLRRGSTPLPSRSPACAPSCSNASAAPAGSPRCGRYARMSSEAAA